MIQTIYDWHISQGLPSCPNFVSLLTPSFLFFFLFNYIEDNVDLKQGEAFCITYIQLEMHYVAFILSFSFINIAFCIAFVFTYASYIYINFSMMMTLKFLCGSFGMIHRDIPRQNNCSHSIKIKACTCTNNSVFELTPLLLVVCFLSSYIYSQWNL